MKKISRLLLVFSVFTLFVTQIHADVPYEVWKTKTVSETTDHGERGNYEVYVVDGKIASDPDTPEGGVDTSVRTRISGINYSIEFRNVGKMGNKDWKSFGGYEKAKLTISFNVSRSYHMQDTGVAHPMFPANNMYVEEEDETRYIDDITLDLVFSGGPYGKFTHQNAKGSIYQIGDVVDGRYIQLEHFSYELIPVTIGLGRLKIPIDKKMFGKWMEKLNETDCVDSGIRFSDYNGEVMVRPHSDEDAWYGAALDIVLCVDDHVKTGDDSFAVLSLADMTTFKMKPESELILSSPPKKENKMKLIAGKVLINVKRMLKDGTMDVEMSQAAAGIKGTILELEETGTESKLKVFQGSVQFTSNKTGETSLVEVWETQNATSEGLSEKTTFDDKDVVKSLRTEKKQWDTIKEIPLKPLLSEEEIIKIHTRDPDRGEIILDPDSIAPDGVEEVEQNTAESKNSNKSKEKVGENTTNKENTHNSSYVVLVLILVILGTFYYLKSKKV